MNPKPPNAYTLVGLGEVLWDMLPGGKQLGGAPANFAYHANALGATGIVASCIGTDDLGAEMLTVFRELGLDAAEIEDLRGNGVVG